jgi:hypothetical protein
LAHSRLWLTKSSWWTRSPNTTLKRWSMDTS